MEKLTEFKKTLEENVEEHIAECEKRNSYEHKAVIEGVISPSELKYYFTYLFLLSASIQNKGLEDKEPSLEDKESLFNSTNKILSFFYGEKQQETERKASDIGMRLKKYKEDTGATSSFTY